MLDCVLLCYSDWQGIMDWFNEKKIKIRKNKSMLTNKTQWKKRQNFEWSIKLEKISTLMWSIINKMYKSI